MIFILYFCSCLLSIVCGQSVHHCGSPLSWMLLSNQTQVNQLGSCSVIVGSLSLNGSDIHDLSMLRNLTRVDQTLVISNTSIVSFRGLNRLLSIGDSLLIQHNPLLQSMDGLEGLMNVTGGLTIHHHPVLANLSALRGLRV